MGDVIDLAARRSPPAGAELVVAGAVDDVLASIHDHADGFAAIYGLARALRAKDIASADFAQWAQMTINILFEIEREPPGAT